MLFLVALFVSSGSVEMFSATNCSSDPRAPFLVENASCVDPVERAVRVFLAITCIIQAGLPIKRSVF